MPLLLILFFSLAEIAVFIMVGRAIGVIATLALILATSIAGATMLRDAGILTVLRLQQRRGNPAAVIAEGGARMIAGLLLMIPGFLTDLMAVAVLVPGLRRSLLARMRRAGSGADEASPIRNESTIIDGEFRHLDDDESPRLR
jgi:UPF0716 protein FxsA